MENTWFSWDKVSAQMTMTKKIKYMLRHIMKRPTKPHMGQGHVKQINYTEL